MLSLGSVTAERQKQLVNQESPTRVEFCGSESISSIRAFSSPRKGLNYSRAMLPLKAGGSAVPWCSLTEPTPGIRALGSAPGSLGALAGVPIPLLVTPCLFTPACKRHKPLVHRWRGSNVFCATAGWEPGLVAPAHPPLTSPTCAASRVPTVCTQHSQQ